MTVETLQTIAAVLPLVLLTLVVERRNVLLRIRKSTWFRNVLVAGASNALVGTAMAIIGIATNGLSVVASYFQWLFTAVAFLSLVVSVLAMIVTSEIEEDAKREETARKILRPRARAGRKLRKS